MPVDKDKSCPPLRTPRPPGLRHWGGAADARAVSIPLPCLAPACRGGTAPARSHRAANLLADYLVESLEA
jgi:hypothetical protein